MTVILVRRRGHMSPIKGRFCRQFAACVEPRLATLFGVKLRLPLPTTLPACRVQRGVLVLLCGAAVAHAQPNPNDVQRALDLAQHSAAPSSPAGARIEVVAQALDSRLKLAPCQRAEPFLAAGAPVWGRTRVGLRCAHGAVKWTVYLPVQVQVWALSWAPASALPAGAVLTQGQLVSVQADWASSIDMSVGPLAGRILQRAVPAGRALRASDLLPRRWFAAGDTVQLLASGSGFSIAGSGQALAAGIEGQLVRVRTENGRILSGRATGQGQVEVSL